MPLTGVKLKGSSTCECEICAVSKMHKIVSRRPRDRATIPFQKVHWNLIYHEEEGWNKEWYTSRFQDDCTRFHIVYTIRGQNTGYITFYLRAAIRVRRATIWNLHSNIYDGP